MALLYLQRLLLHRQQTDGLLTQGHARLREGALQTALGSDMRHTLEGAEVHHRLIEGSRLFLGQQRLCKSGKQFLPFGAVDRRVNTLMTRQHTIHIAIDHRCRQSESDASDGGSRIVAHPFQRTDALEGGRESPHRDDLLRRRMEVARPTIVPQSLPLAQHLVLGGGSERLDSRPAVHEPMPVGLTLLDACLLEDNLRQPDGIGITRLSPRQIPAVVGIPA